MSGPNAIPGSSTSSLNDAGDSGYTLLVFQSFTSGGPSGSGSFALPFPVDVSINSDYNWSELELGTIGQNSLKAGSIVGGVQDSVSLESIEAIKAKIGLEVSDAVAANAGTAANAGQGKIINPKKEVLFAGIDHRQFKLDFSFAPLTAGESEAAYDFIKKLHKAVAPEGSPSDTYFIYPDTAEVTIFDGGKPILKRQECAVTNVDCNFTPDGLWATYTNGKPVHIRLSITFQELQLPTKENAEALFGG